jgi:Ferritin-like domain
MTETRTPGQTNAPADKTSGGFGRRRFLAWSSTALLGAIAFGGKLPGLGIEQALAQTPGGAMTAKAVDLGEGDVGILNYAYALEQLEAAFYTQVTKTPYANMTSADKDILTGIRDHEIAHRDFFKAALKKNAIPALDVDFTKIDFNSRDSVLKTGLTFEDLGVAAYNGAGQLLKKEEYLLIAGKIVSVEARHATALRYLIGMNGSTDANANNAGNTVGSNAGSNSASDSGRKYSFNDSNVVDEKGLDRALKPTEVLATAAPFVKTPITADDIG